ncbi:Molybdenum cofactor sulfurase [Spironucleus salmonicida]|uniref:Molybdenum cofactor sulfurase n=1 Tax=Spironucleus salmonicida TaxID=348837 RepID=V6LBY9_9EUKA|nr:Molybdenum cofactor sulfurase [Spironucleus salmonicida]|eukprot:EST42015.1 Molybdenum cofactor sulfurase [Spironucleus salmonicida]
MSQQTDLDIKSKSRQQQLQKEEEPKIIQQKNRKMNIKHLCILLTVLFAIGFIYLLNYNSKSPKLTESQRQFIKEHPGYGLNGQLESLRRKEFSYLTKNGTYLDFTGAGMFQESQLQNTINELSNNLYCNTHSLSACSKNTDKTVEEVRNALLDYFNAPKGTYSIIFTASATAALKLVGDSFPWSNSSKFLYSKHNHNSVLGMRRLAIANGAKYQTLPWDYYLNIQKPVKMETAREVLTKHYHDEDDGNTTYNLLAFPAECNFSGIKYPLDIVQNFEANDEGETYNQGKWHVLLDVAAYIPTHKLDLNATPVSFAVMSFYKMFGFPTGIGALIVRNDAAGLLRKTWFAGGSVVMASCDSDYCKLKPRYSEKFEDGSLNYQGILGVKYGLQAIKNVGIDNIQDHICALRTRAWERSQKITHSNGRKLFVVYGEHHLDCSVQGGILSFNLIDKSGNFIGYTKLTTSAAEHNFMLRAGCSCNPGACTNYLGLSEEQVIKTSANRSSCGDDIDNINGIPLGAVRISFGYPNNIQDVDSFFDYIEANWVDYQGKSDFGGFSGMM